VKDYKEVLGPLRKRFASTANALALRGSYLATYYLLRHDVRRLMRHKKVVGWTLSPGGQVASRMTICAFPGCTGVCFQCEWPGYVDVEDPTLACEAISWGGVTLKDISGPPLAYVRVPRVHGLQLAGVMPSRKRVKQIETFLLAHLDWADYLALGSWAASLETVKRQARQILRGVAKARGK